MRSHIFDLSDLFLLFVSCFFGSSIWIFYISWYSLLCLHQHIFFRHGNCILFDRQSLQYHSDRQQWAAVPEHTGSWNWKSHNDGKKEKERKKGVLYESSHYFSFCSVTCSLLLLQMLSEKNVRFYMNDNVTEVRGVDGKVKRMLICSITSNSDFSISKDTVKLWFGKM